MNEEISIPEEIVGLDYHFLPLDRQSAIDEALRALQRDSRLEFLLAVFHVTINGRPLSPGTRPTRSLLNKLLQALDQEEGAEMLYGSPYNDLGARRGEMRLEWWDFDLAEVLLETRGLRSVKAFLRYGTGQAPGRSAEEAKRLHDRLLRGLVGTSRTTAVWSCTKLRLFTPDERLGSSERIRDGIWPADGVSPWFHGVFWDDLIFVLNTAESTLCVLAITSG